MFFNCVLHRTQHGWHTIRFLSVRQLSAASLRAGRRELGEVQTHLDPPGHQPHTGDRECKWLRRKWSTDMKIGHFFLTWKDMEVLETIKRKALRKAFCNCLAFLTKTHVYLSHRFCVSLFGLLLSSSNTTYRRYQPPCFNGFTSLCGVLESH